METNQVLSEKLFIAKECHHGPFLAKLAKPVKAHFYGKLAKEPVGRREIILQIQALAQAHYRALWALCSREEQYVLYDLAQDGLVNTKNVEVITGLLNKGLVTYDGTLWLMNRSFRNFILTAVQPDDTLVMEREARGNGTWNEIKTPLILVVIALVCFIFFTQKETFNQILAVIGSLAALLPLLPKLLGVFSGSKSADKE